MAFSAAHQHAQHIAREHYGDFAVNLASQIGPLEMLARPMHGPFGALPPVGTFSTFVGTPGNDPLQNGTGMADQFDYSQGGNDKLNGRGGSDSFDMAGAFNAADRIDGGSGIDSLHVNGNYAAGFAFTATTLTNVEEIVLTHGNDYKFALHASTVAAGATLTVNGNDLANGDTLNIDATALGSTAFLHVIGSAGRDTPTGGAGDDDFELSRGGNDTATGGAGSDTFTFGAKFTASDSIRPGAAGHAFGSVLADVINLDGNYSGAHAVVFGPDTLVDTEAVGVVVAAGHSYDLTLDDANVIAGASLTVLGSALGAGDSLIVDGSAETDGALILIGGSGADTLIAGSAGSTLDGHGRQDHLTGGIGADKFLYFATSESTGLNFDILTNFDFLDEDKFVIAVNVSGIDANVVHGTLSISSFDADLIAKIDATHLGANHVVIYKPGMGDLAGKVFLIVDHNGVAGYQGFGAEYVMELDNASHMPSLDITDFDG